MSLSEFILLIRYEIQKASDLISVASDIEDDLPDNFVDLDEVEIEIPFHLSHERVKLHLKNLESTQEEYRFFQFPFNLQNILQEGIDLEKNLGGLELKVDIPSENKGGKRKNHRKGEPSRIKMKFTKRFR